MFFTISNKMLPDVMWQKALKHAFSVLYANKTWVFDQSGSYSIYITIFNRSTCLDKQHQKDTKYK